MTQQVKIDPQFRELREGKDGLYELIQFLVSLTGDVAKLEVYNNFEASKRVRAGLIEMRNVRIPAFESKIRNIRSEIKTKSINLKNQLSNGTTEQEAR